MLAPPGQPFGDDKLEGENSRDVASYCAAWNPIWVLKPRRTRSNGQRMNMLTYGRLLRQMSHVAWSVCLSCAKTGELIEMPFGADSIGPKEPFIRWSRSNIFASTRGNKIAIHAAICQNSLTTIRSTLMSRPNKVGLKCPFVRPSTNGFFDFN